VVDGAAVMLAGKLAVPGVPMFARRPVPRSESQRRKRRRYVERCQARVSGYDASTEALGAVATVPRLRDAPEWIVYGCAVLYSQASERVHATVQDAISVHHLELEALFGRGFRALNERYHILEPVAGPNKGQTTAWRKIPDIASTVDAARRDGNETDAPLIMVNSRGWRRRTLPPAIDRSSIGNSIWRQSTVGTVAPVDTDSLRHLDNVLEELAAPDGPSRLARLVAHALGLDPNMGAGQLAELRRHLSALRCRTRDALLPRRGLVHSEYRVCDTGRLFEVGAGSLQGAHKALKACALNGRWVYDIDACHATILLRLAAAEGIRPPTLADYVDNKDERRAEVARRTGLTRPEVKRAFNAATYGSRRRFDGIADGITEEIGSEKAAAFHADPYVKDFIRDVAWVGRVVVPRWARNPAGFYNSAQCFYNPALRLADGKRDTQATKLAHIAQGEEALALHGVVTAFPDDLILLEHDGWVSRTEMDVAQVERVIEAAVGYRLMVKMEKKRLPDTWAN
jgi:hypothetical protein